ncbi:MAG: cytochrome b/b6 domain-containing protein [Deltaproteobacteria bacterium]|nr:cytochrome b/b6 domain-containing protein [Deltaproteobacteria bacterium]
MHSKNMILKHPLSVRIFHYLLVISFVPLAVTGLILYFKPFSESTMNLTIRVHVIAGILLTFDALSFFMIGYKRVVLFLSRVFSISGNDFKWFAVLGGYPQKLLLHKKVPVPPMGKYNSGQKLFGVCVFIGGVILIFTGLALWAFPHNLPRGTVALLGHLHTIAAWALTLFLCVHIFLGIYMFDDFKAMFLHGKIPYEEAKEMAPLWVEKEIIPLPKN